MTIRSSLLLLAVPITLIAGEGFGNSVFAQSLASKHRSAGFKRMKACPLPRTETWTSAQRSDPTDMTGVYDVTIRSSEITPNGKAKLTIEKDRFTLSGDSWTNEGRLVATTTGSYTTAALAFQRPNQAAAIAEYQVVSVRAVPTRRGGVRFSSVCGEKSTLTWSLASDRDRMYDVHFITSPTTNPVNIMKDLEWRQCKDAIQKCRWQAAGDPEKMLGKYHYHVQWPDGKSREGELEVTSNKTFTITAP